jgi:hypothetical protein
VVVHRIRVGYLCLMSGEVLSVQRDGGDVCVLGLIRGGKGSLIALPTAVRTVSTFAGGLAR